MRVLQGSSSPSSSDRSWFKGPQGRGGGGARGKGVTGGLLRAEKLISQPRAKFPTLFPGVRDDEGPGSGTKLLQEDAPNFPHAFCKICAKYTLR